MQVLGIDFTSRPSRRKPITCLHGRLDHGVLYAARVEDWATFALFEGALRRPGPWIAGLDFPFGQARSFVEAIGWPATWEAYVAHASGLGREGFRTALTRYREPRAPGDKEHRRATDVAAGAISPQKLHGVPVGLMFFEGAPRLVDCGVAVPHLRRGDPARIAVEAYPGVLASALIGRRPYKNDARARQTPQLREARENLLRRLFDASPERFGFALDVAPGLDLCTDPGGDRIDALLCAVQAAWSWSRRADGYGAPATPDPLEGWIADPSLRGET